MLTKMMMLVIFLWSFACVETVCLNATLCISNENEVECQATTIIDRLSNFPEYAKSCKNVDVQLTSGTHILKTALEFSSTVQDIAIHGSRNGKPSIIDCLNKTGIQFSEKKYKKNVHLNDLIFKDCSREGKASLHFVYATYSLENVKVENSKERSVYAYHCNAHRITNCTFRNSSKGHIQIRFHKTCKKLKIKNIIRIIGSHFFGGMYGIEIKTSSDCHYDLNVTSCDFNNITLELSRKTR